MAALSYSSRALYKACGYAYKLRYVTRLKPKVKANTRPFLEGGAVHLTLENSLKLKKPLDKELTLSLFPAAWEQTVRDQQRQGVIRLFPRETLESIRNKAREILISGIDYIKYLKLDEGEFHSEYAVGRWDAPLKLDKGLLIHGKIDQLNIGPDGLRIFDFKTSQNMTYVSPEQLVLYVLAIEKLFNKPVVEAAFLMLRNKQKVFVPLSDTRRQEVLDAFIDSSNRIDAGEFEAHPSEKVCKECSFRMDCQYSMADATSEFLPAMEGSSTLSLGEL